MALAFAVAPACGAGAHDVPGGAGPGDAGSTTMPDAGADAPPGRDAALDAGVDAPPEDTNPFPDDPAGGEFAWAVSLDGAVDTIAVATDGAGNIVIAARQLGAVAIGDIHVAAPSSFEAVLVLKLTATGTAVWGRSLDGHPQFDPQAIATTPSGDVVVGATASTAPGLGKADGLVVVLDGDTGATRWSAELASTWDDRVAGIAAGTDAAGDAAIYVYGQLGHDAMISGQALAAGAYLIRYDADGALRWALSFPSIDSGFNHTLALDLARGPVIAGNFGGDLTLGDQTLEAGGTVVAGFDPDGNVRFARQLLSSRPSLFHSVAVEPGGDVYVASDTSDTETVVDDHIIPVPGFVEYPFLLRLTADGHHAFSTVISDSLNAKPVALTAAAAGSTYLSFPCGKVDVQPEIVCDSSVGGSAIVSYRADNEYQWATYVKSGNVLAVAAAPGNRLIVAGETSSTEIDLGGVRVATHRLFIAALAGGAARPPSPLPPAPTIAGAVLEGVNDGQIRQGGTGTLKIQGTGLDLVTAARLGDIDIHVPPSAGTPTALTLDVMIPHGHALGALALRLGNAGGSAQVGGVVTVTPIVVTPSGSNGGRGTFTSPWRLCRDWSEAVHYGDVVLLRNGVHACDDFILVHGGVTFRGETKAGAVVRGVNNRNDTFRGFLIGLEEIGVAAIENMTIESADFHAVLVTERKAAVTDVDIQGVSGSGVWVEQGGTATVTRYNYLQSPATAIVLFGGKVTATAVRAEGVFRGVLMTHGTLTLADSLLSSSQPAVLAGDQNALGGSRDVTITNTTLRSKTTGLLAAAAKLTVSGCTIEPLGASPPLSGVELAGGVLAMSDSQIHGYLDGISAAPVLVLADATARPQRRATAFDELEDSVSLALDHLDITAPGIGIVYDAGVFTGQFSLRRSHVRGDAGGVSLLDRFTVADLGTAAAPGDNQLESTIEPALWDLRMFAGPAIDAHGTTLNGAGYAGDVLGPVSAADYEIHGPNTIRF